MRRLRTTGAAIGVALALAGRSADAQASTYSVTGTSDATGSCTMSGVCSSLRAAVTAANSDLGSLVQLGANTYSLSTGELPISVDMTIAGAGAGSTTIQQTDGSHRVILVNSGSATVTISGLTIASTTAGAHTRSRDRHRKHDHRRCRRERQRRGRRVRRGRRRRRHLQHRHAHTRHERGVGQQRDPGRRRERHGRERGRLW